MSPKHFTVATTALFSASMQTHCALVICNWMSDCSFTQHILNIHQSGYNGWCYVKLLLSWCKFWHAPVGDWEEEVCTSLQCHFIRNHMCRVHVYLAVICHLYFWQNDWALLCGNAGMGLILKWVSTENWPWRRKFSHRCAGTWTQDLLIMSLSLYHWAIPAPTF